MADCGALRTIRTGDAGSAVYASTRAHCEISHAPSSQDLGVLISATPIRRRKPGADRSSWKPSGVDSGIRIEATLSMPLQIS
jgi:hypothetical protein